VITIRPAVAADAGEILTVQRAAYLSEGQAYRNPFIPPLTETLDQVAGVIGTILVAVDGTRIVGSVRIRVADGTGHIGRLAVAPDRQGQGIGTMLVQAAEQSAPAEVSRFELFTGAASTRNIELYQRLGYTIIGRLRGEGGPERVQLNRAR
jgi:ribosomal protein S18 acetylase RimI-like enzyme